MQFLGLVLATVWGWLGYTGQDETGDEGDYMAGTRLIVDAKGPGRPFTKDLLDYEM